MTVLKEAFRIPLLLSAMVVYYLFLVSSAFFSSYLLQNISFLVLGEPLIPPDVYTVFSLIATALLSLYFSALVYSFVAGKPNPFLHAFIKLPHIFVASLFLLLPFILLFLSLVLQPWNATLHLILLLFSLLWFVSFVFLLPASVWEEGKGIRIVNEAILATKYSLLRLVAGIVLISLLYTFLLWFTPLPPDILSFVPRYLFDVFIAVLYRGFKEGW